MKKNLTEVPKSSLRLSQYLIPMVILVALMGLAIVTFSKSVQQLSNMPNAFSQTGTQTPTLAANQTLDRYMPKRTVEPFPTFHHIPIPTFNYVSRPSIAYQQCFTTINRNNNSVTNCVWFNLDTQATGTPAVIQSGSLPIEERGWIEILNTSTVILGQATPTTLTQFVVFHGPNAKGDGFSCKGCYVLELLPSVKINVPVEDINGKDIIFRSGESYQYLIKGSLSKKTADDFFLGSLPIFEVAYLERVK